MILNGIYDYGKIVILDKYLPRIKVPIKISIEEEHISRNKKGLFCELYMAPIKLKKLKMFLRNNINER